MARFSVSQQTEGALLAALAAVLSLATLIPILGAPITFVAPVPIIMAAKKHGIRHCLVTALVASILLAIVVGPTEALRFSTLLGGTGVIIGTLARKNFGPKKTLILGSMANILLSTVMVFLMAWTMGLDGPFSDIRTGMAESWTKMKTTMQSMPVVGEMMKRRLPPQRPGQVVGPTMEEMIDGNFEMMDAMLRVPIYVLLTGGVFLFIIEYLFAAFVMARFDMPLAPLPPLREWYLPSWATFLVLSPFFLGGTLRESQALLLNMTGLSLAIFSVMGLASMSTWLHKRGVPRPARWCIYLFTLFMPFVQQWVLLLGIADSALGWRDPRFALPPEEEGGGKREKDEGAA